MNSDNCIIILIIFVFLTGENGDNPPHFAVSKIASSLGHSHVEQTR